MCGIFGAISKDPKNISIDKVIILGILNEERGTTSCGISLGDEILTGTGTESKFRNFAYNITGVELTTPYIIGHTRQASVGISSRENAHPFGFGENPKTRGFQMIGVHNGTLYNYEDIAEERGIDLKSIDDTVTPNTVRTKIDSEILLESIYKDKNFSVLEQYHGGAALAFVNTVSEEVHLYSGASNKGTLYYHNVEIERPLHVWIVNDELMYFSSEANPLIAIAGINELDNIFQIDNNFVYTIKNGNFKNALKKKIDRSKESQVKTLTPKQIKEPTSYNNYDNSRFNSYNVTTYATNNSGDSSEVITFEKLNTSSYSVTSIVGHANKSTTYSLSMYKPVDNCTSLDIPGTDRYGLPSMCNFKYSAKNLKTKKLDKLQGVHIRVEGRGLFKVGDTFQEFEEFYSLNKNNSLNIVTDEVCTTTSKQNPKGFIRELFKSKTNIELVDVYYLYEGYVLRDYVDYLHLITGPSIIKKPNDTLDLYKLSHISKFPVKIDNIYHYNGTQYTGTVKDNILDRTYYLSYGKITQGNALVYIEDNYAIDARKIAHRYYDQLNKQLVIPLTDGNAVTKDQALVSVLNKYNPQVISVCGHIQKGMILKEDKTKRIKHLFLEIIDIYEKQPNDVDFYLEVHHLLRDETVLFTEILGYFQTRVNLATSTAENNYLTNLTKLLRNYE